MTGKRRRRTWIGPVLSGASYDEKRWEINRALVLTTSQMRSMQQSGGSEMKKLQTTDCKNQFNPNMLAPAYPGDLGAPPHSGSHIYNVM
jgi:hypothetical protein